MDHLRLFQYWWIYTLGVRTSSTRKTISTALSNLLGCVIGFLPVSSCSFDICSTVARMLQCWCAAPDKKIGTILDEVQQEAGPWKTYPGPRNIVYMQGHAGVSYILDYPLSQPLTTCPKQQWHSPITSIPSVLLYH